jgi:hypothetical protein
MAKWDHDDLMSKYINDDWIRDAMAPKASPKRRTPLVIKQAVIPKADDPRFTDEHLEDMLSSRMGWDLKDYTFRYVLVRRIGEQAAVVVTTDADIIVIKDYLNLFPSDAIVTQLRLLENK